METLSFFSKKLAPAEVKYSTFDRELLAAYATIRHFRFLLEGRQFRLMTDHKPLVAAMVRVTPPQSAGQQRHLAYISEFTTDLRHTPGSDNVSPTPFPGHHLQQVCQSSPFRSSARRRMRSRRMRSLSIFWTSPLPSLPAQMFNPCWFLHRCLLCRGSMEPPMCWETFPLGYSDRFCPPGSGPPPCCHSTTSITQVSKQPGGWSVLASVGQRWVCLCPL